VRPAALDAAGLVVTVFGESGGVEARFDFAGLPAPAALLAACACGFGQLAGPGRPWRAAATCENGYKAIREFLRYAATCDPPPATGADVTPVVWAGWRLSRPPTVWGRTCQLITRQWLPMVPGIPAGTAAAAARRIPAGPPPAEAAYTREEFEQIKAAAARTFGTALRRIRSGREHLQRWHAGEFPPPAGRRELFRQTSPATADYLIGEALDSLLRTGDVPLAAGGHRTVLARHARALGGAGAAQTWARLFLTLPEASALAVLLVCDQGWNRAVLDAMTVPDATPGAGDDDLEIYRVQIFKRRPARSRYTSANLVDDGPTSSGRLMRQAVEATEPARIALAMRGEAASALLVSRRATPAGKPMFCPGVPPQEAMRAWAARAGLAGGDGPLRVSMRRLRRTVQVLVRRESAQNTEQTHESVYVLRDPATREATAEITARGLANAAEHARAVMTMRMLLDASPGQLTDYARNPEVAQALADGLLDTPAGACLDSRNSPFSPPGQPCTASFLACLGCRNAVATRRHLPRLAYLHQALDALRATVDAAVWDQDWRGHFLRLSALLDDNTTAPERAAAAGAISDADRGLIDRLLAGGYAP